MDLTIWLYLSAGLGALGLGGGALLHLPGRRRTRLFALLCAAIALWNLGKVGELTAPAPAFHWTLTFLLGPCIGAPLVLNFALAVAGRTGRSVRVPLGLAYAAGLGVWVSAWSLYRYQPEWNLGAMAALGVILSGAVVVLFQHMGSLPEGPVRGAARLVFAAVTVGAIGGLTDFLPRGPYAIPKIGPAAVLFFVVNICAVEVRYRFLDVSVFLARAVSLLVIAAGASFFLDLVARRSRESIFPLFLATLLVLAVARPVWRVLLSGARNLLGSADPLGQALVEVSRKLPLARDLSELRGAIEEGRQALPERVRVTIYLLREPEMSFRLAFRAGSGAVPPPVEPGSALPLLLEKERAPLTRFFVEVEARESWGERRKLAAAALEQLSLLGAELVAPFFRQDRLAGWVSVGGGRPNRYLTAEVAAALMAVGNQAVASLDRIEVLEAAKRREALAAVGEMAAGLAHEVRNPLGAIRGAVQVLASETNPAQAREMMEVIEEETERLGRVVGEFLEYARPASPRRDSVDIGELARRVLRSADAAGLGLRAEMQVDESAPPVLGDPDQLQRAFGNLVQNARDAAGPEGALRVEVAPAGEGWVAVRFEDNGPGIPPEQVARIFQPFHTTKTGGTGLGLALVHRVVEAHGGEVRVEGRPGIGAAFTVVLPAAREMA